MLLGIVGRTWMRLIAEDPEFTWVGTVSIITAFALHGLGSTLAARARQLQHRRAVVTSARVAGGVLSMGLFAAAGAVMLPTVVGAALALHRTDWPRLARWAAALLAVPVPVLLVMDAATRLLELGVAAGFVLLVLTYAVVIVRLRPVVARLDSRRMSPMARVFASLAGAVGLLPVVGLLFGIVRDGV